MSDSLNPAQRRAVETTGRPLAVVAGAGSGKTRVLTHRYVRLVLEQGARPDEILALTFTDKAALEMRSRIRRAFVETGERALARAVAAAPISTIHGLCARLLRERALEVGLDPAFTVVEEWRATEWMGEALGRVAAAWRRERPEALGLIRRLGIPEQREDFLDFYDALRAAGTDPADLARIETEPRASFEQALAGLRAAVAAASDLDGASDDQRAAIAAWLRTLEDGEQALARNPLRFSAQLATLPEALKLNRGKKAAREILKGLREQGRAVAAALVDRIAEDHAPAFIDWVGDFERAYAAIKRDRSALDFSDLEHFARDLFRRDARVRAGLGFRHLLVDEYQDTNPLQEEILAALEPDDGRFAVGDPQQAIYGFRHADVQIMKSFVEGLDEEGHVALDLNYRSRPEVLEFANWLLAGAGGPFRPLQAHRARADDGPRVHVALAVAGSVAEARKREAEWMARRIRSELARGIRPGEIAVLLRWMSGAELYERVLRDHEIDAHVERGGAVLATQEAAELSAALRALDRPEDALAHAIVLRSPLCGIGDGSLHALSDGVRPADFARELPDRLDRLEGEERARLADWLAWWRPLAARAGRARAIDLLSRAIDASDYRARLAWAPDGGERLAHVAAFVDALDRYDPGPGLRDAVELLDRLRMDGWRDRTVPAAEESARVRIQTIHAAKGLEFPVVFVADLANGRATTPPPYYLFDPDPDFALAVPNPYAKGLGAKSAKTTPARYDALKKIHRERGEAENARLLYVALTRAEERLYLSAAVRNPRWSGWSSEYLQAIDPEAKGDCEERPIPQTASAYTFERIEDAAPAPARGPEVAEEKPVGAEDRVRARAALAGLARPLPPRTSAHETVTATEILAFSECPRRYFLEHVLGFRPSRAAPGLCAVDDRVGEEPFTPGSDEIGVETDAAPDAASLGVAAHAVLERWDPRDGAALDACVRAVCESRGIRGGAAREDLARWARSFYETDLGAEALAADAVHRELPFASRVGDAILRGSVDLAWIGRDGLPVIVDYKSTVADPARRAAVADAYAVQVALYALALEAAGLGRARRGYLHYLRDAAAVPVDLSADALARAEENVRALLEAQRTGAFPPRAGRPCAGCPSRASCSAAV